MKTETVNNASNTGTDRTVRGYREARAPNSVFLHASVKDTVERDEPAVPSKGTPEHYGGPEIQAVVKVMPWAKSIA
ncbi:MAG TPA: hypothetical protein VEI52_05770 [Terriglobales bacterium]|nr:hypothetical protein [Terriglobales bacterium]